MAKSKKTKAKKPVKRRSPNPKPATAARTADIVPARMYVRIGREIEHLRDEAGTQVYRDSNTGRIVDVWFEAMRGVQVYRDTRTVVAPIYPARGQNGERAEFDGRDKAWQLFFALWQAKEHGVDRQALLESLWSDKTVSLNNLDQQKRICNRLLLPLRIEMAADNRGVWRLTSF